VVSILYSSSNSWVKSTFHVPVAVDTKDHDQQEDFWKIPLEGTGPRRPCLPKTNERPHHHGGREDLYAIVSEGASSSKGGAWDPLRTASADVQTYRAMLIAQDTNGQKTKSYRHYFIFFLTQSLYASLSRHFRLMSVPASLKNS
jgi:hypothetical protein